MQVMIGDMAPLLRSAVTGMLGEEPDFFVAGEDDWHWSARDGAAPVLLVAEENARITLPDLDAPGARGGLGVVTIAQNGREATVVRLTAHRLQLASDSRTGLADAIRAAAGVPRLLQ